MSGTDDNEAPSEEERKKADELKETRPPPRAMFPGMAQFVQDKRSLSSESDKLVEKRSKVFQSAIAFIPTGDTLASAQQRLEDYQQILDKWVSSSGKADYTVTPTFDADNELEALTVTKNTEGPEEGLPQPEFIITRPSSSRDLSDSKAEGDIAGSTETYGVEVSMSNPAAHPEWLDCVAILMAKEPLIYINQSGSIADVVPLIEKFPDKIRLPNDLLDTEQMKVLKERYAGTHKDMFYERERVPVAESKPGDEAPKKRLKG